MDLCTEDEVGHVQDGSPIHGPLYRGLSGSCSGWLTNTWTFVQRMKLAMFRMALQYMDLCTEDEVGHVQDGSPIHGSMYRG